jgi:nickel-dependent lactate racemase
VGAEWSGCRIMVTLHPVSEDCQGGRSSYISLEGRPMDRTGWKRVRIVYGESSFPVVVPGSCDVLVMKHAPGLRDPRRRIEHALSHPIGGPTLEAAIAGLPKPVKEMRAVVAVSDHTRPVPYHGEREDGILLPILKRLEQSGVRRRNIAVVVATGTHAATSPEWKRRAFGDQILDCYEIEDHDCSSPDLCSLGSFRGIPVKINPRFFRADIRIVTGLVEPHFMAGFSGGRKVVCPGLVNLEATHLFHGAEYMDDPHATNLVLEDNPCHAFAVEVARKAGVHFSLNVMLNDEMVIAGLWAGDLEKSHEAAVDRVQEFAAIKISREYEIVLTHGGRVAVNHYQAVKAAYGAIPLVKPGGVLILIAHNTDAEPVGKDGYKELLGVLREKGPGAFTDLLKSASWQFTPDQWEVQKLDQFFKKVGSFDGLIYCTNDIEPQVLQRLPGRSGYDFVKPGCRDIASMVQGVVDHAVASSGEKEPRVAYVKDGPYSVPVLEN